MKNPFRLEKEFKAIKERIVRDSQNLSEPEEEENYYKLVRVSNFLSKNYIEYESNHKKIKQHQLNYILIKLDHI